MKDLFTILVDDIIILVLSEWIETEDLVRLDTAVCNHSSRPIFLDLVKSKCFSTSGIEDYKLTLEYFKWLIARNIHIRKVQLKEQKNETSPWVPIMQIGSYFEKTREIYASLYSENFTQCFISIIMKRSKDLEVLDLSASSFPNGELDQLLNLNETFPNMKVVNFSKTNLPSNSILKLTKKCPNLESFEIEGSSMLNETDLLELTWNSPSLKKLILRGCQVTDRFLVNLPIYCPYLSTLDISNSSEVTDNGIISLVENSKMMILDLNLNGCKKLSDLSLIKISDYLPYLRTLDVGNCPMVSDYGIEKVAYGCKQLNYLVISDCDNISRDIHSSISHFCPYISTIISM